MPLNESPLKDHPLNPMHDSNLVRVLARQSRTKVSLVALSDIARDPDAVRARLADLAGKGFGAAIADAVFDRDLETIGTVALDHLVSVGRLRARAWARPGSGRHGPSQITGGERDSGSRGWRTGGVPGRQLFAGHLAADRQSRAGLCRYCISIPTRSSRVRGEARRALGWAKERLGEGPVLIASSSTPEEVAALQSRHGRDAAGHAIEQAMADIAEGLVQSGVRRLVVAGGENLGRRGGSPGNSGLLGRGGNRRRVPVLRAVGVDGGGMLLALKSGNFGGPEFFSDALKLMR